MLVEHWNRFFGMDYSCKHTSLIPFRCSQWEVAGAVNWATEIWDLRSIPRSPAACSNSLLERHLRYKASCGTPAASWLYQEARTELLPHLRLLNGSACELSPAPGAASCLSCRGSHLEGTC